MTPEELERLAREAGFSLTYKHDKPGTLVLPIAMFARFAALVRAQAEAEAHAAIDASPAQIVRNRLQGYPGTEDHVLTLVERIQALDKYATDYKRWCIEAEGVAMHVRAQALEQAAQACIALSASFKPADDYDMPPGPHQCAAAIRALGSSNV